jgi:hypothetical protein
MAGSSAVCIASIAKEHAVASSGADDVVTGVSANAMELMATSDRTPVVVTMKCFWSDMSTGGKK